MHGEEVPCLSSPARGHLVGAVCTYVFILLSYKLLIYVYLLELKALYYVVWPYRLSCLEGALPYPVVEVCVFTGLLLVGCSGSRAMQTWRAQVVEKRGLFGGRRGTVQVLPSCKLRHPPEWRRRGCWKDSSQQTCLTLLRENHTVFKHPCTFYLGWWTPSIW